MTALKVLAAILCAFAVTGWSHGSAPGSQTAPVSTSAPLLTGTFTVGGSLVSSNGGWNGCSGGCTFGCLFYREGVAQGTRSSTCTYSPATADLSSRMSVDVVATNSFGASSPALSLVSQPIVGSTVCYVSLSDGNDSNDCTTSTMGAPHGPIQHISAVNAKTFAAGTSVLLKRGDRWDRSGGPTVTGTLIPSGGGTSGNPVVYDAYGTGALPAIDQSADASTTGAWTNIGTNLWQSVQTFPPITNVAVTFTGSPGNPINVIWGTQLPYAQGSVVFAGSSLPTGLNVGQTYYILSPSGNSFQISLTPGGTAINAGASFGSGTTAGVSGFPYGNANDVGNILWGFTPLGGSAPAGVMNASYGQMAGAGVGGVWYLPGEGTTTLATNAVQGQWNFNTDNFRVQIYSVGNPATAMPGLRLALDSYCIKLVAANNNSTFQNLNCQYIGGASGIDIIASNITVRDSIVQSVGGGNIGGASGLHSRAGDGMDPKNSWDTILLERNYVYQVYDVDISPQLASGIPHNNVTIRNNIFHRFATVFGSGLSPGTTGSTQTGLNIYNNTAYGVSSWSANQRPDGGPKVYGLSFGIYDTTIAVTGTNVANNAMAGIGPISAGGFGMLNHYRPDTDLAYLGVGTWDYNLWRTTDGTATEFGQTGGLLHPGNTTYAVWQAASYGGNGIFDAHGLIDIDPGFTNQSAANFTPTSSSPLRNAGTNLYSAGVVWDFFRNPRPSSGPFTIGAIQYAGDSSFALLTESGNRLIKEDGTGAIATQ